MRPRRVVLARALAWVVAALAMAPWWPGPASAQVVRSVAPASIRFGILPVGGAVESRNAWTPLLADMGRAIGRPVGVLSVNSYEALELAIQRNEVDLAFLSGKLALDAVMRRRMNVLAQVEQRLDAADHRAVLLVRKAGPLRTLDELLARPERWRLARGDSRSVSGFIAMETRFRSETIDTHQGTALAVANGDADVATNNTTDFERFRQQFPAEAARLEVIWRSAPTPPALFVVRLGHSQALQQKLQDFIVGYGRADAARGDAEREVLKSLHAGRGYVAAGNAALLPAALLDYQFAMQQARQARWIDEGARQARFARIEADHARHVAFLNN